jgi:hypothetical protein
VNGKRFETCLHKEKPDGSVRASGSHDDLVRLWDVLSDGRVPDSYFTSLRTDQETNWRLIGFVGHERLSQYCCRTPVTSKNPESIGVEISTLGGSPSLHALVQKILNLSECIMFCRNLMSPIIQY